MSERPLDVDGDVDCEIVARLRVAIAQQDVETIIQQLQACSGFISRRGQSYVLHVARYEAPVPTVLTAA
jgi:hypothetical protein